MLNVAYLNLLIRAYSNSVYEPISYMNTHMVKIMYLVCRLADVVKSCAHESDFSKNISLYLKVVALIDQQQSHKFNPQLLTRMLKQIATEQKDAAVKFAICHMIVNVIMLVYPRVNPE